MRGSSKQVNGRALGPVLLSGFLVILKRSVLVISQICQIAQIPIQFPRAHFCGTTSIWWINIITITLVYTWNGSKPEERLSNMTWMEFCIASDYSATSSFVNMDVRIPRPMPSLLMSWMDPGIQIETIHGLKNGWMNPGLQWIQMNALWQKLPGKQINA